MKSSFLLYIVLPCAIVTALFAAPEKPADIEGMKVIQAIGIDREGEGLRVSLCTAGDKPERLSAAGRSIQEALEAVNGSTAGTVLFDHVSCVFLGEELCREDMERCADWFCGSDSVRMDIPLYIIRSGSAADAIRAGGSSTGSGELADGIEENIRLRGGTMTTVCELKEAMLKRESCLAAALECVKAADSEGTALVCAGMGIVRSGVLAGFLDENEASAAELLTGREYIFSIELEDRKGAEISLRLRGEKSRIKPVWDESGALSALEVRVDVSAEITEGSTEEFYGGETEIRRLTEQRLSVYAARVINRSRAMGTDFLHLGGRAERLSLVKYSHLSGGIEEALGGCEIRLSVNAEL